MLPRMAYNTRIDRYSGMPQKKQRSLERQTLLQYLQVLNVVWMEFAAIAQQMNICYRCFLGYSDLITPIGGSLLLLPAAAKVHLGKILRPDNETLLGKPEVG